MSWTDAEIGEVLERHRRPGNDGDQLEAKSCTHDLGGSVWESVSAFTNTRGGTLLLGICEDDGFMPRPGFDSSRIISQFIEGIGDGSPQGVTLTHPAEYIITHCENNDMPFLAIDVFENNAGQKPCYITAKGPQSSGYRHIDVRDVRLSPTEVFEFNNAMISSPMDRCIVKDADLSDLDVTALNRMITANRNSKALSGAKSRARKFRRHSQCRPV